VEPEEPGVARVAMDIPSVEGPKLLSVVRTALGAMARATRVVVESASLPRRDGDV
jgi:hypothetical protein